MGKTSNRQRYRVAITAWVILTVPICALELRVLGVWPVIISGILSIAAFGLGMLAERTLKEPQ